MKLSTLKDILNNILALSFQLENGDVVPAHFHLTEVGHLAKKYMDCGGKLRQEDIISLQLWSADDTAHRLTPQKFLQILSLAEDKLSLQDWPVEVEYQTQTIGKFDLEHNGSAFILKPKQTACLAMELCCVGEVAEAPSAACTPGGGCC